MRSLDDDVASARREWPSAYIHECLSVFVYLFLIAASFFFKVFFWLCVSLRIFVISICTFL